MVAVNHQSHRVSLQPAFILHGRDFRDTSRLLDVFTLDYGLLFHGLEKVMCKL